AEAAGVNVDPLAPVLRVPDGDELAGLDVPPFEDAQRAVRLEDDGGVHPRRDGRTPLAGDLAVGGEVRRREEPLRQDPVGRRGHEPRVGRAREARLPKIRASVESVHTSKFSRFRADSQAYGEPRGWRPGPTPGPPPTASRSTRPRP